MIKIVEPEWKWMKLSEWKMDKIVEHLEECGRNCYKSEDRITPVSADKFVRKICRNRHESVLEHEGLTAKIRCSRAASHQLVRHRIAAYSQESMRYVNYGKRGLQVICPPKVGLKPGEYSVVYGDMLKNLKQYSHLTERQLRWLATVEMCYKEYLTELDEGMKPEDARFVLPHACKTEVVATYNMRTWRHVIEERGLNKHAQWEIRGVFSEIYDYLRARLPSIFEDLE